MLNFRLKSNLFYQLYNIFANFDNNTKLMHDKVKFKGGILYVRFRGKCSK